MAKALGWENSDIPLCKPSRGHNGQLLAQLTHSLRTISHNHNSLLHSGPSNVRRAIDQEFGIDLARTGNAEEGRRRYFRGLLAAQREIGEFLGRTKAKRSPNMSVDVFYSADWDCGVVQGGGRNRNKGAGLGRKRCRSIRVSYRCAPSERAMNGSNDQSFSVAGSVPSSPMQCSISGPLYFTQAIFQSVLMAKEQHNSTKTRIAL